MSKHKDEMVRCAWCGTAESRNWIHIIPFFYCSRICYRAKTEVGTPEQDKNEGLRIGITAGLGGAFIGTYALQVPLYPSIFYFVAIFLLTTTWTYLCFYCMSIRREDVERYRKRVPPGSRHKEYIDQDKLKDVIAAITCPVCDADIDPSSTETTGTYHCEFCGANVKLPEWTR